ncbi:MAG: hypothetical protein ACJA1F_003477 [Paracoccaceae bacterium]
MCVVNNGGNGQVLSIMRHALVPFKMLHPM